MPLTAFPIWIYAALGLLGLAALFFGLFKLLGILFPEESPVKARLQALKAQPQDGVVIENPATEDVRETLLKLLEPVAKNLYGDNVSFRQKIKTRLTEAGLSDGDAAVNRYLVQRVASSLVFGALGFAAGGSFGLGFIWLCACLIAGLLLGGMLVDQRLQGQAARRKTEIRYTLSDALDLMVVCVEAGLGLDATIQRVGDETERMAPEISQEFKRVTRELSAGLSRQEAFHNLGTRSGSDDLRSLCALIIQSDKLGTSIADTLRIYANDIRTKRRQRAEELASKASIKMTLPLVFLIFPPLFIVLLGPMVIQTIEMFSAK